MYDRWQKTNLIKGLKNRRVIFISGPRQCGKTTLARELVDDDSEFITLDNNVHLQSAKDDPSGFVKRRKKTLIIDEIQKAPELLPAIKEAVDQDNTPGQYLLTGSANILAIPTTRESLAGRVKYVRLRPLCQGEIVGAKPNCLDLFFEKRFSSSLPNIDKEFILDLALKGGFPEPLALDEHERKSWFADYVTALLEKDLKDISTIYRMDKMRELLEVSAAWSGKLIDIQSICSKLGIQRSTLEGYMNALQTLYLVEKLSPWINTDYERVGKKAKLFMADCGLMSSCLNLNSSSVRFNSDQSGKLVETFVYNELITNIDCSNGKYRIFHYRDRENREIDFLIERDDGAILGIEVKAGTSVNNKLTSHLEWFKENLAQDRQFIGIVIYTGSEAFRFKNGMWAVPIANLWGVD